MDRQEATKGQPDASHPSPLPSPGHSGLGQYSRSQRGPRQPWPPGAGVGRTHWRLRVRVPSPPQEREQGPHRPQGPKPPAALEQSSTEQDSFPCVQELERGWEDEGPAARTPGERGAGRHVSPQGRGDSQGEPGVKWLWQVGGRGAGPPRPPPNTSSHPPTLRFPPPQISHTLTSCGSLYGGSDPSPTHRQAQEADHPLPEETGEPPGQRQ